MASLRISSAIDRAQGLGRRSCDQMTNDVDDAGLHHGLRKQALTVSGKPSRPMMIKILGEALAKHLGVYDRVRCHLEMPQRKIALHEFMEEGHYGRHIRRMRLIYGERAAALEQAMLSI